MGTMASKITSLTIVYTTVYSGADQSKHQSSASLAFVWGIHRGPVNSPHKWPVTRKMFPFDDVIMRQWITISAIINMYVLKCCHDDVIKWKHFPRYWPFVRGIHRPPVNLLAQRTVTRSFAVFFDLRLNKLLSEQSRSWWLAILSRPLWRHCNVRVTIVKQSERQTVQY